LPIIAREALALKMSAWVPSAKQVI